MVRSGEKKIIRKITVSVFGKENGDARKTFITSAPALLRFLLALRILPIPAPKHAQTHLLEVRRP